MKLEANCPMLQKLRTLTPKAKNRAKALNMKVLQGEANHQRGNGASSDQKAEGL